MTRVGRLTTAVALAATFALSASAADLKGILIDVACSSKPGFPFWIPGRLEYTPQTASG